MSSKLDGHLAGVTRTETPSDFHRQVAAVTPQRSAQLVRQTRAIAGWLSPGAVYLFALIDSLQKQHHIEGNLFEIGVHHGKSAIVLGAMVSTSERLGVCDIFGAQGLNVSASGKGDREIFQTNFRRAFPDDRFLVIYEKKSSDLTADEITPCRFLHVDGGHSSAEALADLELCVRCLTPGGVIVVDDAFNPTWPGVTDAIFRFLSAHPQIVPLVVGFNKMLVVEAAWRDRYAEVFKSKQYRRYIPRQPYSMKIVEVFGHPTYVFYVHSSRSESSLASWIHRVYLEHPAFDNTVMRAAWRSVRGLSRAVGIGR